LSTLELVSVAVATPLYRLFDYLAPAAMHARLQPGVRVRVPFGKRTVVGVVVEPPRSSSPGAFKYRPPLALLDDTPLLSADVLELLRWAAQYYQYPLGRVIEAALPGPLRRGNAARDSSPAWVRLSEAGATATPSARAHRLLGLLAELAQGPRPDDALDGATLRKARDKGWIEDCHAPPAASGIAADAPEPSAAQCDVLRELRAARGFTVSLLEGVTGSGKTEIYLQVAADALSRSQQALILVPEIGLTPQLVNRFEARFPGRVAPFHSGMSESQRAQSWLAARDGRADIVIGTRSAVFVPFRQLGIVVVDEEHDASYKQQEGFRYSARDTAVFRAQQWKAPVILGSATPSLETLANARAGRYRHLRLPQRVHQTAPPRIALVDARGQAMSHGLTSSLLATTEKHLSAGGQVLLFINRRGFAPALLCRECGWVAPCKRCDARMTLHRSRSRLICHHCGYETVVPQRCGKCQAHALAPVGQGTERIEDALRERFPNHRVERFDSDRVRRAGELERLLRDVASGDIHILVGTQMLAKGHDFAGLSMVGIVSVDQALFGVDFRALERMGQLVVQVAGRAGRGTEAGEVLLQTHEPQHPKLRTLIEHGYGAFADELLAERVDSGLPPASHLALLRAESLDAAAAMRFLHDAKAGLKAQAGARRGVAALGPVAAPMERRAGRWRAQLLLQAEKRAPLQRALSAWVPGLSDLPSARQVRWSIDVDPVDLY